MKVLLDTNIIIHREAHSGVSHNIGNLFNWLDKLKYDKYIHPLTIEELNSHKDSKSLKTMNIKLDSYNRLKHQAPIREVVSKISQKNDLNKNDKNDTIILNEVYEKRVDILISEDKKIHFKAHQLGISAQVFRIQNFLEKVIAENPELVNYKVLAVKKVDFAEVEIKDSFFDSLRQDYDEFDEWFNSKAENPCYVCYNENRLIAFLYIKIEEFGTENYSDIKPIFKPKRRLKIGTLKVNLNGFKIGERFLKIIFDHALLFKAEEIYVTVFNKRTEQEDLIELLKDWGFNEHGIKRTKKGDELVFVREFGKHLPVNIENPKLTFPFFSRNTNKYIIKIQPEYHTELFPDSINTREDKSKYTENEPHRNRISKVYISHAKTRNLNPGDIFIIYRIGETPPKIHSSTLTTICIVESIKDNFNSFEDFFESCNRKTMISKSELESNWWNKYPNCKPFVINFLYAHALPTPKPTLNDLINLKIIENPGKIPQGFIKLSDKEFSDLINFTFRKNKKK